MKVIKNNKLKNLILLFIFIFSMSATVFAKEAQTTITVYHTNDVHGRVDSSFSGVYDNPVGISEIAAVKENTINSVLLDAGDSIHGTPIASLTKGFAVIELMNSAGYDFMTLGNHEFNYGYNQLLNLKDLAQFTISSSNVKSSDGFDFDSTSVLEINGVKLGICGLTTESTTESTMPSTVSYTHLAIEKRT